MANTLPASAAGVPRTVGEMMRALASAQVAAILMLVVDWATMARHAAVAHYVLSVILRSYSYEKLRVMCPSLKHCVEALLPYTERSYKQSEKLTQRSFIIDYTLSRMNGELASDIIPEDVDDGDDVDVDTIDENDDIIMQEEIAPLKKKIERMEIEKKQPDKKSKNKKSKPKTSI